MADVRTREALFVDCLQDLWMGERASLDAWADLTRSASSPELRAALQRHERETQEQAERLKRIARDLRVEPSGPENLWMAGMLRDCRRDTETVEQGPLLDVALIGAWRKIEEAEAASYETAVAVARALGREDDAEALAASLAEERGQDVRLLALLAPSVGAGDAA